MKLQGTAAREVSNLVGNMTARFPHTFENMRRRVQPQQYWRRLTRGEVP